MRYRPAWLTALMAVTAFAFVACGSSAERAAMPTPSTGPPAISDNGSRIFLTGRDAHGVQITAQKLPRYPSCAACHNGNGSGGVRFPGVVSADLRHDSLTKKIKPPYTLALLERAIATGLDSSGKPLDPVMPHWKLSKTDLHDVAVYVWTKLK